MNSSYDPRLVFVHIPKCAGSSVRRHFSQTCGMITFRHGPDGLLRNEMIESGVVGMLRKYHFINGHFTVNDAWPLINQQFFKAILLAIVREPGQQIWSYFHWIKAQSRHPLHACCAQHTFLQALAQPEIRAEFTNIQTRYLLGSLQSKQEVLIRLGELIKRPNTVIVPLHKTACAISRVHTLLNLNTFNQHDFGKELQNVSPPRTFPTKGELEAINDLTKLDAMLYEQLITV